MAKFRLGIDLRLYGAGHSGLGRYSAEILDSLLRYGRNLEIIGFIDPYSANKEKLAAKGVTIIDAPYRPYSWQEQILLPTVIAKAKVDLMHFPHFNVPLAYGGPYVVTIHDLIMHHFPWRTTSQRAVPIFLIKHLAYRAAVRWVINRARAVIAVSRYTAEDILTYYPRTARRLKVILEPAPILGGEFDMNPVRNSRGVFRSSRELSQTVTHAAERRGIISNGMNSKVSRDLEKSEPNAATGEYRDDKDILLKYNIRRPYILIVGNLYPHKNIGTVVRVWRRLYSLTKRQMVIVGRLDVFARRLYNEALVLGLVQDSKESPIRFLGFVGDHELRQLYSMAEYYLNPSLLEGVGLTGLEALAMGTAVLSSPNGPLPETYQDSATYIPVDNEEVMYRALYKIFNNQVDVVRLEMKRGYNLKDVAAALENCYREALRPKSNR